MLIVDHNSLLSTFGDVSALPYVHGLVLRGLQMSRMPKEKAKVYARPCSLPALIGSRTYEEGYFFLIKEKQWYLYD